MFIGFCTEAGWETEDLVRVYGGTREQFAAFCDVLWQLARAERQTADIHALPGFVSIEGTQLIAHLGPEPLGVRRVVGHNCFEIVLDQEGWRGAAERAEAVAADVSISAFNWLVDAGDISLLLSVTGAW